MGTCPPGVSPAFRRTCLWILPAGLAAWAGLIYMALASHVAHMEIETVAIAEPVRRVHAASFGAKPDDWFDDGPGIARAIRAVAGQGGGEVVLSKGSYQILHAEKLPDCRGVTVNGYGRTDIQVWTTSMMRATRVQVRTEGGGGWGDGHRQQD